MADSPLQLSTEQLVNVCSILRQHLPQHEVRVFGSRARGQAKPYSDLDLVIMGDTPLPLDVLGQLTQAFAESNLPWRVDLVDWATTSPEFRRHIQHSAQRLTPP